MDSDTTPELDVFLSLIKNKYSPEKIILFGSRARGDSLSHSDYDIIIVSKAFEGIKFIRRMEQIYDIWDNPIDLDVLCYTPEEFVKKSHQIGIVQNAVKEGIVLT